MPKPEMEFTDTASAFLWQPVPGAPAGLEEKILSRDPKQGTTPAGQVSAGL